MTESWPDNAQIRIHPQVLLRPVEDEAVLLHLDEGTYYGLNDVGARMIQVVHQNADLGAAVEQLRQEYDVEATRLRADLHRLLDEMAAQGLIVVE